MQSATTTATLHTRSTAPMAPVTPFDTRAWWRANCRHWLKEARKWRQQFGGEHHEAALGYHLGALLRAERYRGWMIAARAS